MGSLPSMFTWLRVVSSGVGEREDMGVHCFLGGGRYCPPTPVLFCWCKFITLPQEVDFAYCADDVFFEAADWRSSFSHNFALSSLLSVKTLPMVFVFNNDEGDGGDDDDARLC